MKATGKQYTITIHEGNVIVEQGNTLMVVKKERQWKLDYYASNENTMRPEDIDAIALYTIETA